jgi:hypothetical protein
MSLLTEKQLSVDSCQWFKKRDVMRRIVTGEFRISREAVVSHKIET